MSAMDLKCNFPAASNKIHHPAIKNAFTVQVNRQLPLEFHEDI